MSWELEKNKSNYILRYYLPCEPVYPESVTKQRADELLEYCIKNKIEAAMLYVDLNPNWYYTPDSLEHTDYYVPIIAELGKRLRENGISYQLNYQNLFGSWDGGADLRSVCEWENFVDQDGLESWGCACTLGKRFREKAGYKLRAWAKTEPDVIWIDDDIRFSHHRASVRKVYAGEQGSETFDFGCFCDEHIALFNKINGTSYTREQIKNGLLEGNEVRGLWLKFSGECVDDVAKWISDTVKGVSPSTRIAIMTSVPDTHNTEGRRWGSFLTNMSGGDRPLLRPTFGPYVESGPKSFYNTFARYSQLKADIAATYGTQVDFCPEIENTRFTRWAKSMAATGYQLMLGGFLGAPGITLSVYDLDGCKLSEEPEVEQILNERRPMLDKLARLRLWDAADEGIGLITVPDRVKDTTHAVSDLKKLCLARFWDEQLLNAGIPCKYITPDKFEAAESAAIDGYTSKLLTDGEIEKLLSKNLLLDSAAAKELCDRGYGKQLGIAVGDKILCIGGKEIFDTLSHEDGSMVQAPLRVPGGKWRELISEGADVISRIVTPYGTTFPGFTRFENALGGTVYVYASDGEVGDGFYSNFRVKLLKDICQELSKTVKADNHSKATVAVKRDGNIQYVLCATLAADMQKDVVITTTAPARTATFIDVHGKEHSCDIDGLRVICKNANTHLYEGIVCVIEY